jgi:SAM-dependent methyltransferase
VEAVLDQKPRSVLDLGCGEGWLARALMSHGLEVTGVDASAPLIEAAKALGGARFVAATYEDLAANPGMLETSFDTIVANFSLLDDHPQDVLRSLKGTLVVQTVHPAFASGTYRDGWRTETFDGFSGEWREAMPWYFRTIESWTRVFSESGYSIDEIREPRHSEQAAPASILFVCTGHES